MNFYIKIAKVGGLMGGGGSGDVDYEQELS